MKIRLPILVEAEGVEARKRKPTRLLRLVESQVEIREIPSDRVKGSIVAEGVQYRGEIRLLSAEGRIWCPVDVGVDLPPAEAMGDLANDLERLWPTSEAFSLTLHQTHLVGCSSFAGSASGTISSLGTISPRKRLVGDPCDRFRIVLDDGAEAAADAAARISGELAVIGGRLYSSGLVPTASISADASRTISIEHVQTLDRCAVADRTKAGAVLDVADLERLAAAGWKIHGTLEFEGDARENVERLPVAESASAAADIVMAAKELAAAFPIRSRSAFMEAVADLATADAADADSVFDLVEVLAEVPREEAAPKGAFLFATLERRNEAFLTRSLMLRDLTFPAPKSPVRAM